MPQPSRDPSPPPRKPRNDAFAGDRRRAFLDALGKSGCVRDAARRAGVSHQTVYNHQASDPAFARQCELALGMASTDLELHAWERAVVGVEEPILYRGEVVGTRLKRSDAILRLLLQGTKRKRYGPNPGFSRRRLAKAERKRIEREVRDEYRARADRRRATAAETDRALTRQLDMLALRIDRSRAAEGWTRCGADWIPPGWVRGDGTSPTGFTPGEQAPDGRGSDGPGSGGPELDGAEQTPDSV